MNSRRAIVIVATIILLSVLSIADLPSALADPPVEFEEVSIINLIATPDRYDGHLVGVTGYYSKGMENSSLCLVPKAGSEKDCLWVTIDNGPYASPADRVRLQSEEKEWSKLRGRIVFIEATFSKAETGHMGLWSGGLKDISRIVPQRSSAEQKAATVRLQ